MNITATSTVRDLAAGIPGATRVFENFGIDYCCGGRRTLADACREASLPVEDLTRSLEEAGRASQPGAGVDWRRETLTALTEHIVETHHYFATGRSGICTDRAG
jgi:regulator of cell morphogenesis and NO signaling